MNVLNIVKNKIITTGALLLISGCSVTGNQVYHCCAGQSISGDSESVKVSNVWTAGDALPLAMNHCQKYNKVPAFENMGFFTAHYRCIEPPK